MAQRPLIPLAALLFLVLASGASAGDDVLVPRADEGLRLQLDRALALELAGDWHGAIRVYQAILSHPQALEDLVPGSSFDPRPQFEEARRVLAAIAAGDLDPGSGPAGALQLTRAERDAAAEAARKGPVALFRHVERGDLFLGSRREAEVVHVSVAESATRRIAWFPPAGLAAYRNLYDPVASSLYEEARARHDVGALDRIAAEFLLTSYGPRALDRRAELAFESGDFEAAVRAIRRLLRFSPDPARAGLDPVVTTARLGAAYARTGRRRALEILAEEAARTMPGAEVEIGGQRIELTKFLGKELRFAGEVAAATGPNFPADVAGPLRIRWSSERILDPGLWIRSTKTTTSPRPFRFDPVVSGSRVFLAGPTGAAAWDLEGGRLLWVHRGSVPSSRHRLESDQDLVHAPAIAGDLCLFVEDHFTDVVGDPGRLENVFPASGLVALDAATGAVRWRPRSDDPRAKLDEVYLVGPPVVEGDLVCLAGTIASQAVGARVYAFELATGRLRWWRHLCEKKPETVLDDAGKRRMPNLVGGLGSANGILYATTNLGLAAALEARTGRILWMVEYRGSGRRFQAITHRLAPENEPLPWVVAPALVRDERLFLLPTDVASGPLRILDALDGARLEEYPSRDVDTAHRWLLGVDERGRAFAGGLGAYAFDPTPRAGDRKIPWSTGRLLSASRARGGLGPRFVYLPGTGRPGTPEVLLRLDRETGEVVEAIAHPEGAATPFGNLRVAGGARPLLVSVTDDRIHVLEGRRP